MAEIIRMSEEQGRKLHACIAAVAKDIGPYPPGLVRRRVETGAVATGCFLNVEAKVKRDGGRSVYGWAVHARFPKSLEGQCYVYLQHHAIWQASDGTLFDITPYPDGAQHPLPGPGSDILFIVDEASESVRTDTHFGPLPSRFYPVGDDEALREYVAAQNEREKQEHAKLFGSTPSRR